MNFNTLLLILFIAAASGLMSSITNRKHAIDKDSPEPFSRAYWHTFQIVAFLGICGIALLGATRTTDIAAPHTTGIGSWIVCYMVCLFAAEALVRAVRNGIKLMQFERWNSKQLHPMLRGR